MEEITGIEEIALKIMQRNMGITFKKNLTLEQKRSIVDNETFGFYIDEATKLYEKKQRAINNKQYPVIDVPASGKRGWAGGAYCLCFVYSKYNGNFVLRGYIEEVTDFLKKNYTHYYYNKSLWSDGFNRDIWGFWKKDIGLFSPEKRGDEKKFVIRPYYKHDEDKNDVERKTLKFKRLPKRWIPEFDNF